jgi:hypothetical protein
MNSRKVEGEFELGVGMEIPDVNYQFQFPVTSLQ